MRKTQSIHTCTAIFVALCLLFAQLATAAYACPEWLKESGASSGKVAISMVDCAAMTAGQMDPAQPNLCKAHCDAEQPSHDAKSAADQHSPLLDTVFSLVWLLPPPPPIAALAFPVSAVPERPPGSPPLYLLHTVFRL